MNRYINEVLREVSSLRSDPTSNCYTMEQCLKVVEIASLKSLDNQLKLIGLNLRAVAEMPEQLGEIAEDLHDLKEAIVRENKNVFGKYSTHACIATYRED